MNEVVILLVVLGAAPAEDRAFFEARVRPILVERCYHCHSARTGKRRGGLQLDGRAAFQKGGDSGPAAVPGRPEQSLLVRAVRHAEGVAAMPPSGALPAREVAVLEEWVRRGAFYPDETVGQAIDLAAGRKFWSFVPPRPSSPPAVKDRHWPRRPIDAFLLAEMERQGLVPSPPADGRALIRRLHFDLAGLP